MNELTFGCRVRIVGIDFYTRAEGIVINKQDMGSVGNSHVEYYVQLLHDDIPDKHHITYWFKRENLEVVYER